MTSKNDFKELINIITDLIKDSAESVKYEIKKDISDRVITRLDKVMGELKTMREEQTIVASKQSEHSDTIENHENRIIQLEENKSSN